MKIKDVEHINHLLAALTEVKDMIATATHAPTSDFELLIEHVANSAIRISESGGATARFRGATGSPGFLASLKKLAVGELTAQRRAIEAELAALGVETDA